MSKKKNTPNWTNEELAFLKTHYRKSMSTKSLSKLLARSKTAIYCMANTLKLCEKQDLVTVNQKDKP